MDGHWAVYYTSPQSFIISFSLLVGLTTFVEFDWMVYQIEYPNVSTINCSLRKELSLLGMYIHLSAIVLSLYIPGLLH